MPVWTLDFASFGGRVTIDLTMVGPQVISPGLLTLSLSGPTAIEDVHGSAFNDIITGNARDNRIYGDGGADVIDGGPGNDYIHGSRTQLVYLDFDSWVTRVNPSLVPLQHVYTQEERDAIQSGWGRITHTSRSRSHRSSQRPGPTSRCFSTFRRGTTPVEPLTRSTGAI